MYFLVLFAIVFLFLTFMAWRSPAQWPVFAGTAGMARQGAGQGRPAAPAPGEVFARLLQGECKEDKPCLTPIDCVQSGKCAGHCGCR